MHPALLDKSRGKAAAAEPGIRRHDGGDATLQPRSVETGVHLI